MSKDKEIFEKVYEKPKTAVWTHTKPPEELVELIETGKIKPCKVIDVGCGEGFYSIYLALKGFNVIGVDISENAIKLAKENAEKAGVDVRFKTMDVLDLSELEEKFDFVFEWAIMHHIMFEQRQKYVREINKILNKGGKYFSMCFNEQDLKFGEPGKKIRTIPEGSRSAVGAELYFSSLHELKKIFDPYFKIIEKKVFQKIGARGRPNVWNYFFMKKL